MTHRVWLVDDEPHIRTAMAAVLADLNHEVRAFANAEELYRALVDEGQVPDLVILDQRLPDEFGSTIAHSLRERPQYRDIPLLFVTAIEDEEAARLEVIAPVIRKPFDFAEFVDAVQAQLQHSPAET